MAAGILQLLGHCAQVRLRAVLAAFLMLGLAGSRADVVPDGPDHEFELVPTDRLGPLYASESWTLGQKRVLVYVIQFADEADPPITTAMAEAEMQGSDDLFRRISFGKFSINWTITPPLLLTNSAAAYSPNRTDLLLAHARAAALAAGFNWKEFDLDVVRHGGVPGFASGSARLGQRGAWVQMSSVGVIVHEIGHNLGLTHANAWSTRGPSFAVTASPPFPSNFDAARDAYPADPDSLIGHDDIRSPGSAVEYGDVFDLMSSTFSSGQFNSVYKRYLGWLDETNVVRAATNGVYRLHGFDVTNAIPGRIYSLQVVRDVRRQGAVRNYWIEGRAYPAGTVVPGRGLMLRWAAAGATANGTLLLDAALPLGKTFADAEAGIFLTAVATGGEGEDRWYDVAVEFDPSGVNHPPEVSQFLADAESVSEGTPVTFTATAADSDGDELSWFWDFGDGSSAGMPAPATKTWSEPGNHLVRLEVSDRRGGVAIRHLVVRVGQPAGFQISGRVVDPEGRPVAGARVHNGVLRSAADEPRYHWTFTDSNGAYVLTGLPSGTYTNGVFLFGHRVERRPDGPVAVSDSDVADVDFVVRPQPRIRVGAARPRVTEGEHADFVFTREGPTNGPLRVSFVLAGSARPGIDYSPPAGGSWVEIPAGEVTATLSLRTSLDSRVALTRSLTVSAVTAGEIPRTKIVDDPTSSYTVFYPGWELGVLNGSPHWQQSAPSYLVTPESSATALVDDRQGAFDQLVSVVSDYRVHADETGTSSRIVLSRVGRLVDPLTVGLSLTGAAGNGSDYELVADSVTFAAGEASTAVEIRPLADALPEDEESVLLVLQPGPGYGVDGGTALVRITDEPAVALRWPPKGLFNEGVAVVLEAPLQSTCVLEFSTDFQTWTPFRTNLVTVSPTNLAVPVIQVQSSRLYRARLLP